VELPEKLLDRISFEPTSGCWLWMGVPDKDGYGRTRIVGVPTWRAHRAVYFILRGYMPVSLDHLCRVRSCVNPDHLEDIDIRTNILRGGNARKTHCKRGHLLDGGNIIWEPGKKGRHCRICNRMLQRKYAAAR